MQKTIVKICGFSFVIIFIILFALSIIGAIAEKKYSVDDSTKEVIILGSFLAYLLLCATAIPVFLYFAPRLILKAQGRLSPGAIVLNRIKNRLFWYGTLITWFLIIVLALLSPWLIQLW